MHRIQKSKLAHETNRLADFIFTGLALQPFAQQPINKLILNGTLKDSSNNKPVAYATVSVWDEHQVNIVTTYSLENGSFKVELPGAGTYKLELSCVGYRFKETKITYPADQQNFKADVILMAPGEDVLQEIKITGRRRLIEQNPACWYIMPKPM